MRSRFPFAVRAGTAEESRRRGIRLVTAALIGTALVAFVIVGSVAVTVAKRIAREDALAEAVRTAQNTADVLFAPVMPQVLANSPSAITKLNAAVAQRRAHGLIFRVKVWKRDGTVVYSDERKAIGRQFPLDEAVRASIDHGASSADISDLTATENVTEAGKADQLVEVYTPLVLADGQRLAFEIYSSDARVRAAEHTLITKIVPFALLSLLILIILQLPVSVWLVRRVSRGSAERATLLGRVLTVSENERRSIAHDLHDSVVQDLAGVGYALDSLTQRLPPGADTESAHLLARVSTTVQTAVRSLRTLIVDIYPPELSIAAIHDAITDLLGPLHTTGVTVEVTIDTALHHTDVSADACAMIYRCARECITNITKHAHAHHATITLHTTTLHTTTTTLTLTIEDDGTGLPPTGINRRAEGHLGLRLLHDAVTGMGGHLTATPTTPHGTTITVTLPTNSTNNF